jgi:hypothetical protein
MKIMPQIDYANALYSNKASLGSTIISDKQVSAAIMKSVIHLISNSTDKPTGADVDLILLASRSGTTPAEIAKYFKSKPKGSTSIVLLSEDHTNPADYKRGSAYIQAMDANPASLTPNLVVFERELGYSEPMKVKYVTENSLETTNSINCTAPYGFFGKNFSKAQRSMIVAGYLVLCAASGSQNDTNSFLLFFGANHNDIFKYFEYLLKQNRFYNNVSSNVK